jgi:hypothetical protein
VRGRRAAGIAKIAVVRDQQATIYRIKTLRGSDAAPSAWGLDRPSELAGRECRQPERIQPFCAPASSNEAAP